MRSTLSTTDTALFPAALPEIAIHRAVQGGTVVMEQPLPKGNPKQEQEESSDEGKGVQSCRGLIKVRVFCKIQVL